MPTTTTFALPYPATTDNNNVPADMQSLANAIDTMLKTVCPAGTIRSTLNNTADTGWLLDNQAVANAQTLYVALWAVAPASWKSGSTLNIPNLADVSIMGAGSVAALGAQAGANTVTLVEANLPPHAHTGPSHTHTIPSHSHTQTLHDHNSLGGNIPMTGAGGYWLAGAGSMQMIFNGFVSQAPTIQGSGVLTSDASGTAATGNGNGTSASFSTVQKVVGLRYQIRAY